MNKVIRTFAFAAVLLVLSVGIWAQGGQGGPPPAGGGQGGRGGFQGGGGPGGSGGGGRGQGRGSGFVAPGAARTDIYTTSNGISSVGKKTAAGEQFFIIGSVDLVQQQILLKWPTEVTLLLKVTPNTKFVSEGDKPLKLSDFRAGDTVWVTYSGTGADATAVHVRAGVMTVDDLHKYYLDYGVIK